MKTNLFSRNQLVKFLLIFGVLFISFLKIGNLTFIKIDISNSHSSNLKIYWQSANSASWSESKSISHYVNNKKDNHIVTLPISANKLKALRLDPSDKKGVTSKVRGLSIYSLKQWPIKIAKKSDFISLNPNYQVNNLKIEKDFFEFTSQNNDANFSIKISEPKQFPYLFMQIVSAVSVSIVILLILKTANSLSVNFRFVPIAVTSIAGLIIIMALISRENSHPDEVTHINNALYYSQHFKPPIVCSDETLFTYSTYGVSRLNNREIAYYMGGRYLQVLNFLPIADYLILRTFNLCLFLILTILAFKNRSFRLIMLPVLLTPQAWYIFSYYNSDALSLFVCLLTCHQLFTKSSWLRSLFDYKNSDPNFIHVIGLSVLFAMLFWLKLNFVFFLMFLVLVFASWVITQREILLRNISLPRPMLSVSLIFIFGGAMFFSWETWRHGVNDFELSEKAMECREVTAGYLYKPSTPLEQTHPTFRLREKGMSFSEMIEKHNWTQRIFYTGLGAYGYTEYLNNLFHYKWQSIFIIVFFLYIAIRIIQKGNNHEKINFIAATMTMMLLLFAAAYNSWNQDLQAQGRYLLPFIPIVSTLIVLNANLLNQRILYYSALMPFLLGVLSFILIGLVEIPKL